MSAGLSEPLVSVIIPTRNRVQYLDRSLTSVFAAIDRYPNTELIVIDGASTDGALNILKKYDSKISYWVSEPDTGVGEAVNKGFDRSRGEIVVFFGDDDELFPDAIRSMVAYLQAHPEVDAVFGAAENVWHHPDGRATKEDWSFPLGQLSTERLLAVTREGWPTAELQFSHRRLYERFGSFDTQYRYLGSYETWLRQVRAGAVLVQLPEIVARRHYTPDSGNVRFRKALNAELARIVKHYGGNKALLAMKIDLARQRYNRETLSALWRNRVWFRFLDATRPVRRAVGLDQKHLRRKTSGVKSSSASVAERK